MHKICDRGVHACPYLGQSPHLLLIFEKSGTDEECHEMNVMNEPARPLRFFTAYISLMIKDEHAKI